MRPTHILRFFFPAVLTWALRILQIQKTELRADRIDA